MTISARTAEHLWRRAIAAAVRAPSVHNTQPWSFVVAGDRLTLRADRRRQVPVLDPTGRQMLISCGCALLNLRVWLAAAGVPVHVARNPDPRAPDLLTVLAAGAPDAPAPDPTLAALEPMIAKRHTNRRRFTAEPVPDDLIIGLVRIAAVEDSVLYPVTADPHRAAVAALSQRADAMEYSNPAYRAEVRAWTTDDPARRDGVPALAVPHVGGESGDEIPIRDFDSRGTGWLPTETASTRTQCLLLLGSVADDPQSWLRAGEALERILLEIVAAGFTASPLTQVVEIATTRAQLRQQLALSTYPHVLLRVGRAAPTPGTPRRAVADVLVETAAVPSRKGEP